MINADFTKWRTIDSKNKYKVSSNRVEWNQIDRSTRDRVFKDYSKANIGNFEYSFSVNFSSIEAGVSTSRLIIHLLSCMNDGQNQISVYAVQIGDIDDKWKIVFFQRKNGKNVWVFFGNYEFNVNKSYHFKVTRYVNVCRVRVYDDVNETKLLEDSEDKIGVKDKYRFITVARAIDITEDKNDWSSGYIENLKINGHVWEAKLPKYVRDMPKYEVFIAYYRMSAKDYAEHLWEGLEDIGIPVFLDIKNIPLTIIEFSETWRKYRDEALKKSNIFLLIITRGFNTSSELKYEFELANEGNIEKIFFKRQALGFHNLKIEIKEETLDLSQFTIINFETKEDLLRKVGDILEELEFIY